MKIKDIYDNNRKYKSIKESEPLDEYHLVKTHKELYCRICNLYDCYHGLQKVDTFIGLHQENNCDIRNAQFFIINMDDGKLLCDKSGRDMTMREILENFKQLSYYLPKKVTFKCENDCFLNKKYKEICDFMVIIISFVISHIFIGEFY